MTEAGWDTDEKLTAARERFAAKIPGYVHPAAYAVARVDGDKLTFGAVNGFDGVHNLPAVVLATVCGYTSETATFELTARQLAEAAELLAPAEAATHWDHPNLWSWRELLDGAEPTSTFVAFYLTAPGDPAVNALDTAFRARL